MRSLDEHRAAALALASPLPVVAVGLADARGCVLAEDVVADAPLPAWANSAMDGYAVRARDVAGASADAPVRLRVVADLPAGSAAEPFVEAGTAARIMTGAPMPPGADCVVPVEATDAGMESVAVRDAAVVGRHVRPAGDDAAPGDLILAAGALVGPGQIAALAGVGRATVPVRRRPRIAVISTGDELAAPGEPLSRGRIHDSNSWLLAAAVQAAGAEPVRLGPVADSVDALLGLLAGLDGQVDGIVTSGGVSAGAYDVVKAALTGVEFLPVAVQPGKPQGLGRLPGGTPIWTLPGNPVSTFASFEMFVRPAIQRMRGLDEVERPRIAAVAAEGWRTPPDRAQLMPIRLRRAAPASATDTDESTQARVASTGASAMAPTGGPAPVWRASSGGSGSHLVARLALADGLAIVPADVAEVHAGDPLEVFLT